MTASSVRELIERYYYEGWNKANGSVMQEILDENVKFRGSLAINRKSIKGVPAVVEYMQLAHSAIAKNTVELEDVVIDGNNNKVAVRTVCRGLHKGVFFGVEGSGHEVHWSSAAFFTITNGKITEIWTLGDLDSLRHQIGADPEAPAFTTDVK